MNQVTRRRGLPRSTQDLPESLRTLPGYDLLLGSLPDADESCVGHDWEVRVELPADLDAMAEFADPLVIMATLTYAFARIEDKTVEVVALARREGKTWTAIGEALGMSKQAAWERYSNEE